MIHLTMNQLSAYLDGQLRESSTELVRRHLEMCEECTGQFAALSTQEAALVRLLARDPGEEFFARLEGSVGAALAPAVIAPAPAKPERRVAPARPVAKPERRVESTRPNTKPERPVKPTRQERRAKAERPKHREDPAPQAKEQAKEQAKSHVVERVESPVAPMPTPVVRGWKPFVPTPAPIERPAATAAPAAKPVEHVPATAEPTPSRVERAQTPARRVHPPARSHRQPAVPWFFAVILAVIVGAIAYVLPRSDRPAAWMSATPTPHRVEPTARPESPAKGRKARAKPLETGRTAPAAERVSVREEPVAMAPETETTTGMGQEAIPPSTSGPTSVERSDDTANRRDVSGMAGIAGRGGNPGVDSSRTTAPVGGSVPAKEAPAARQTAIANSSPLGGRPSAAEARPDPFASIPAAARPFITEARRAAKAAATDSSAVKLDAAANAWERAIPVLDQEHRVPAQRNLAEARFQAWLAEPNGYRAAAATAALRTYLVFAPPGSDRDHARALLARVQRG